MASGGFRKPLAAWVIAGALLFAGRLHASDLEPAQLFGARSPTGGALIGIFYDFKQSQKGLPVNRDYREVVEKFLNQGWDESVLGEFYRATQPLYATQVFIPLMPANDCPRAFGVEKRVKPSHWLVHYKGQVSSSTGGTFRFLGTADDFLAVGVNSQTVLVAPMTTHKYNVVDYHPTEGPMINCHSGPMKFGTWFTVKKDEVIDLDVIVGELPGGVFCAYLLIEEKGADKPTGTPFPVFQLVPQTLDSNVYKKEVPPFSSPGPPWKAVQ